MTRTGRGRPNKLTCARGREKFVSDGPLQMALRELRATYTDRAALAIIGGVGLIAGLAGPFDTFETLSAPLRVIYWLAVAYGTYASGLVGAVLLSRLVLPSAKPAWTNVLLMGLGASLPVTLTVVALNLTFLSHQQMTTGFALWLYPYCLAICTALMALMQLVVEPYFASRMAPEGPAPVAPALLDRLPADIRGPLSHLSMADHYVEVFTARGKTMVLMRLADAIRETEGVPGLQIHRSHWVAREAVKGIRRIEGRTMVEMKSGALLPVSRSYLPMVRSTLGRES